jgi:uncharacterized membrane protein
MFRSRGLRVSIVGAFIFFVSLLLLIVLPAGVPAAGMIVGGMLVWGGFLWTLFGFYTARPQPPAPK